jgi:hypothetical protein
LMGRHPVFLPRQAALPHHRRVDLIEKKTLAVVVSYDNPTLSLPHPQVKICGLTRPGEAAAGVQTWVPMLSVWFSFPKAPATSPRTRQVRWWQPCRHRWLPWVCSSTPVFPSSCRGSSAAGCPWRSFTAGNPRIWQYGLKAEGVGVIKALFVDGRPGLADAADI